MKEIDEEDVELVSGGNKAINNNGINNDLNTINDGEQYAWETDFKDIFDRLNDIPSRIRFLVDLEKMLAAKKTLGMEVSHREIEEAKELRELFIEKYITDGSPETIQVIFETMGRIKADNQYDCDREYDKQLDGFNSNAKDLEIKALWLFDQTGAKSDRDAIDGIMKDFDKAAAKAPVYKRLWDDTGLKVDCTMKEYLVKVGHSEEKALSILKKRKVSAKEKLSAYFRKLYPGDRTPLNEAIPEEYKNDKVRFWKNSSADKFLTELNINEKEKNWIRSSDSIKYNPMKKPDYFDTWIDPTGKSFIAEQKYQDAQQRLINYRDKYSEWKPYYFEKRDRINTAMYNTYIHLKTPEEKLEYIIDQAAESIAKVEKYGEIYSDGYINKLCDIFTDNYICKGSPEQAERLFNYLGNLFYNNLLEYGKENDKYYEAFSDGINSVDKKEKKVATQKADYLTYKTLPAFKLKAIKNIRENIRQKFCTHNTVSERLFEESGITGETTYEEYAKKIGIMEQELQKFYDSRGVKPDTTLKDYFDPSGKMSGAAIMALIEGDFIKLFADTAIDKSCKQNYYNRMDDNEKKHFDAVTNKIATELPIAHIRSWIDGDGKDTIEKISLRSASIIINDVTKKYDKTVGYDQYIRLHTGNDICNASEEVQKDCLLKAFAANALKNSKVEFKLKTIHSYAEKLKTWPGISDMLKSSELRVNALASADKVIEYQNQIMGKQYEVPENNIENYISEMNTLSKNMMPSKGRSKEYIALYDSVKSIGDLKGRYDFSLESDRRAAAKLVRDYNQNVLSTGQIYITGKENVRSSTNGNKRFKNALDSLSLLSSYATKLSTTVNGIASAINTKRNAKPGSEKYVSMAEYGVKRAVAANSKPVNNKPVQKTVSNKTVVQNKVPK